MRLLDEQGKQIGLVTKDEALRKAREENKDLVEIAPHAVPPVVKLINFKKFKYLEEKRKREQKKSVKNVALKGIRLTPFIAENDFKTRMIKGEKFLEAGNQLRVVVNFVGRQIAHKDFGFQVIKKAIDFFGSRAKVVKDPHFEGRMLITILAPNKKGVKNAEAENQKVGFKKS